MWPWDNLTTQNLLSECSNPSDFRKSSTPEWSDIDTILEGFTYKGFEVTSLLYPWFSTESVNNFNEDEKIIKPTINYLKKLKYNISGPYSADTAFMRNNRKKFDVILGMYHDQVLAPLKTLFEYDAFNITLGLPFFRISPDHGPNEKMLGKNKSNPLSLIKAISFLDKN